MSEPKQVIVMRRDLGMRRGKEMAQAAHASMKVILDLMTDLQMIGWSYDHMIKKLMIKRDDPLAIWLDGGFRKIVVRANSEEELLDIKRQADEAGIRTALITDAGATEFHGVPTNTCLAIGPDYPNKIDPITGHLKLL
jgi:PTH2 family peptidyl-tRNA hydrolase